MADTNVEAGSCCFCGKPLVNVRRRPRRRLTVQTTEGEAVPPLPRSMLSGMAWAPGTHRIGISLAQGAVHTVMMSRDDRLLFGCVPTW